MGAILIRIGVVITRRPSKIDIGNADILFKKRIIITGRLIAAVTIISRYGFGLERIR